MRRAFSDANVASSWQGFHPFIVVLDISFALGCRGVAIPSLCSPCVHPMLRGMLFAPSFMYNLFWYALREVMISLTRYGLDRSIR